MRFAAIGLVALTAPASAQVTLEARAGAQFSSILVRDVINQEITVGAKPAPSVVLAVGSRLSEQWHLNLGVRWSRSDLMRREAEQEFTILPLTVWTGTLALRRPLNGWAAIEGTVGGIKYSPGGDLDGTFFQDNAPLLPVAGLSARVEKELGQRWGTGLEVAYDFHRFTTQALREAGIDEHRSVHRLAVSAVFRGNLTSATR
jgi:hypothetical protein